MQLKSISKYLMCTIILIVVSMSSANAHKKHNKIKLTIGGTSDVLFTSEQTGYASASGTFSALVATITSFEPQSDGTILLGSKHNFKTNDNGYFNTKDKSTLFPVADKPGVFMITTVFGVKESGGSLSGYFNQSFTGSGIINFNNNTANVRYEGVLIKKHLYSKARKKPVFKYFNSGYSYE